MNSQLQNQLANGGMPEGPGPATYIIALIFAALMIASMWKLFTKAGKPGWASIVPIYNIIVLLEIAGKPLWWIVLFLLPIVNFIAIILVYVAIANRFGKGTGFAIGMVFLGFIFIPILAFGGAQYVNPAPAAV